MGRRSVNSTKAGKFMNPTDQARKEARRRELKKNKKQRQQVREAVIKQKDPRTIINDLDALDKLEFDTNNPPPYSAKVIEDKRKKLREGLKKIYQYFQKEDPKHAYEIKSIEQDYERRHAQLRSIYESVMQAQRVKLDDIPLPDLDAMPPMPPPPPPIDLSLIPPPPPMAPSAATIIGLPDITPLPQQTKSILKRASDQGVVTTSAAPLPPGLDPPGPPPSSPPDLAEFECDDDNEDDERAGDDAGGKKSIRFGAVETSSLQKSTTIAPAAPLHPPLLPPPPMSMPPYMPPQPPLPPTAAAQSARPPAQSAAAAMYASKHAQKIHEQANRVAQQIYTQQQQQQQAAAAASTIEAKPVLRNKVGEITRFVPTSLMVRRDPNKPHAPPQNIHHQHAAASEPTHAHGYDFMGKNKMTIPSANQPAAGGPTKSTDKAYESFMQEIEKLL